MPIHAIRMHETGAPSVLKWEAIDLPKPGRGEVRLRHTAIGLNFVETYIRRGIYPVPKLPLILGVEGVGVIEALGPGVKGYKPGQRVGYIGAGVPGSYAEARNRTTAGLIKLPGWLDDATAAAVLSKGMTVEYLFNRTHKLKAGETILFYAAAGGVGLIACQWAKAVGATLIGTVSSDEKAKLAKKFGCKHVIVASKQNILDEVTRITKGKGVDVVYDSVGKDTWDVSLDCLRKLGLMVSFGSASGVPDPYDIGRDGLKKSLFITRASAANYQTSDEIIQKSARNLFRMMKSGAVKPLIGQTYALKDAAQAHANAEARKTVGSTVLIP